MKIRKAVITVAGWGTRFLPITKSQPKEMLPLVNKPLIQYAVEEAVASGIEMVIVVTSLGKRAIEDYFDRSFELECILEQKNETKMLEEMRRISSLADICYVRQKEQLGLGHAVLTAKSLVGEEPFALILPDDLFSSEEPVLRQMLEIYNHYQSNVIAIQRVNKEEVDKYGIIKSRIVAERIHQVLDLVEKPDAEHAPSDLAVVGRYILTPQVFEALAETPSGRNQEIQLTDALKLLLQQQDIFAYEFEGTRYDAGTPMGWLKATIALALCSPEIGAELKEYIRNLL